MRRFYKYTLCILEYFQLTNLYLHHGLLRFLVTRRRTKYRPGVVRYFRRSTCTSTDDNIASMRARICAILLTPSLLSWPVTLFKSGDF